MAADTRMSPKKHRLLTINRGTPSERKITPESVHGKTNGQRGQLPAQETPPSPITPPINEGPARQERSPSENPNARSNDVEPPHEVEPDRFFRYLKTHKHQIIVLLTIAVLGTLAGDILYSQYSSPAPAPKIPTKISSTHDLENYIRGQFKWRAELAMFPAMLKRALNEQALTHPLQVNMNGSHTDLQAQSVTNLATNGADFRSGPIVIVGRIRESIASPVEWSPTGRVTFGPDRNTVLESPNKKLIIYGLLQGDDLLPGRIVYFPAVVVAVGDTSTGTATAYVVSLAAAISSPTTSGEVELLIHAYSIHLKR